MSLPVPLEVRLSSSRAERFITPQLRELRLRTAVPGGFASAEISLDRPLSLDQDDIQQFADVYVYDGRSGETVWQGRLADPGRGASANGEVWTLIAEGTAAHARDRHVPLIYVESSTEPFIVGSTSRKSAVMTLGEQADNNAALKFHAPRDQVWSVDDHGSWFYSGLNSATMKAARVSSKFICGVDNSTWRARITMGGGAGDEAADNQSFATTEGTLSGVVVTNFTNGQDKVKLRCLRSTSQVTVPNDDVWCLFYDFAIRSMLYDKSGSELTTGYTANTVTADEIVEDLLGRLLDMYDGANATVDTNTFNIDQLAYPDGVAPADVLDDLMLFHPEFYWAAWEGSPARFEWTQWPTTVRYEATTQDGFESPGSSSDIYNEVSVRWLDRRGRARVNTRTNTVATLDNASLTRTALLDLSDIVGSSSQADRAGDKFLSEHANAPNAGRLTVRRSIFDSTGGREVDPWLIRPGGLIRVLDVQPRADVLNATDRDGVTVFKVHAVEYDATTNTATLELDNASRRLDRFLARKESRRRR